MKQTWIWITTLICLTLSAVWAAGVAEGVEPAAAETAVAPVADLPVIDLAAAGWTPVNGRAGMPQMEMPAVRKTAVPTAAPGQQVTYTITLANSGAVTETVTLTDTLPAELTLVSADEALTYDPATRTLAWTGELPPGRLDYALSLPVPGLPYLDLGDYGLPNLCAPFLAAGQGCDDVTVTFNLGAEGYSASLYGARYYQLQVSADGLLLAGETDTSAPGSLPGGPRWLPDAAAPGVKVAGLWQDLDMTAGGRWHAAILSGYVAGEAVFYAQWQAAPHAENPDLTSSFAIALTVAQWDGEGEMDAASGSLYLIYDHISQPDALVAQGYAIGLQDRTGVRGFTYAYAGPGGSPRGAPPAPGRSLRLTPHFYGTEFTRSFQYTALVNGAIPTIAVNTARITRADDRVAWDTHYLHIRYQQYLPLIHHGGSQE